MATIACSMPASVYSRVARKREFSTLSLRSAVENGSFIAEGGCLIHPVRPNPLAMKGFLSTLVWFDYFVVQLKRRSIRPYAEEGQSRDFNPNF